MRGVGKLLAAFGVVLIAGAMLVTIQLAFRPIHDAVEYAATIATGREVEILGTASISLSPLGVEAEQIVIGKSRTPPDAHARGPSYTVEIGRAWIDLDASALWSARLAADEIELVRPVVRLPESRPGQVGGRSPSSAATEGGSVITTRPEDRDQLDGGTTSAEHRWAPVRRLVVDSGRIVRPHDDGYATLASGSFRLERCDAGQAAEHGCWKTRALRGRAFGQELHGKLKVLLRSDAQVVDGRIRIPELTLQQTAVPDGASDAARGMPEWLERTVLDLELNVESTAVADTQLGRMGLRVTTDTGALVIKRIRIGRDRTAIDGAVRLEPTGDGVRISADLAASDLRLDRIIAGASNAERADLGSIAGRLTLEGRGDSPGGALVASRGRVVMVVNGAQLEASTIDALGLSFEDLFETLIPFAEHHARRVDVTCAMAEAEIHGGSLEISHLVAETADARITGDGTIDLAGRSMEIVLTSYPKNRSMLGSLLEPGSVTPVRVGGELGELSTRPGVVAAIPHIGKSLLLDTAVSGVGVMLPFVADVLPDGADCRELIAHARQVSTEPAAVDADAQ